MRKLLTVGILFTALTVGAPATAQVSDFETCVVGDETLSGGDCRDWYQSQADAAWEGLDSSDQAAVRLSGLSGTELDKYVINYRDAIAPCQEDEICWSCETMGNKICGSPIAAIPVMAELPRTN